MLEFTLEGAARRQARTPSSVSEVELGELDAPFGRIHAQTAKQVVLQRLREAEREQVFRQFANLEGRDHHGHQSAAWPRAIILDVGRGNRTASTPSWHHRAVGHGALSPGPARQGLRARGAPHDEGSPILVSRTTRASCAASSSSEVPEIHAGTGRDPRHRA